MTETTLRLIDGNGHAPDDTPAGRHPDGTCWECLLGRPSCSRSKLTSEYSIELNYDGLTALMDRVFAVWDSLKLDATDEEIGNGFEALVGHVAYLREWTGWGGVPGIYTGEAK